MLNHSAESSTGLMNPDKDPASRPKGMIYWYKEQCLNVVRAWIFALGDKKTLSEKEARRIASNILQFPSPRRLNRVIETLENQGIVEFFEDDMESAFSDRMKMRVLALPY